MPGRRGGKRPGAGRKPSEIVAERRRLERLWYEVVTPEEHEAIIRKVVECAKAGQQWAVQIYLDRAQGKVALPLQHQGDADYPIHVVAIKTDGRRRRALTAL